MASISEAGSTPARSPSSRTPPAQAARRRKRSGVRRALLKERPVLLDVAGPLRRDIGVREDRGDRALRLARATIYALIRVDVILILALVDAVHRADLDAARVLGADTGLGDDVRHLGLSFSLSWRVRLEPPRIV